MGTVQFVELEGGYYEIHTDNGSVIVQSIYL